MIYREKDFNENERPKLLKLSPEAQIAAGSNSQFIILDERQNRFLLSEKFKAHAEINKDLVFVGIVNRIRIYSAENFAKIDTENYEYE
jgi:DNA-binding transcriptional regulator/RsmH inhibitor MraZ